MSNLIASSTAIDTTVKLLEINPRCEPFINGVRTKKAAIDFVGLSRNSKMPCYTLAIPARESCLRGGKLALIENTVCWNCYAVKGFDAMKPAINAKQRRWDFLRAVLESDSAMEIYIDAYTVALKKESYFRFHSAGDIFSAEYAQLMVRIIKANPHVQFWIPTRQANFAHYFDKLENCVLRVSDDMIDQSSNKHKGFTSGVHTDATRGQECGAYKNNGECGDCRACWSPAISHISYKLH